MQKIRRILRGVDAAVADHGDLHGFYNLRESFPIWMAGMALRHGPGMNDHTGDTTLLREYGQRRRQVFISADADADLDG